MIQRKFYPCIPSPRIPFMFPSSLIIADEVDLQRFEVVCETAVRMGGSVLMEQFGKAQAWQKGPGDWVSQADLESERVIRSYLFDQFPEHLFLGEESTGAADVSSKSRSSLEFRWIVDPLDGTVNFLHGLRSFSVSVGLLVLDTKTGKQQIVTGSVFDPALDECFVASIGRGARLNGLPIQVSDRQQLDGALTVVSTSTRIAPDDPQVKRMLNVMGTSASMRRLGSAALNLCYLACGRVDAYWATNLSAWDVAAGWLIASEAGAVVESLLGRPLDVMRPEFCGTATVALMKDLRPLLTV